MDLKEIEDITRIAVTELIDAAGLTKGQILVVGCSTSEIAGNKIGTGGNGEIAAAIFNGIFPALKERGIYLAAQCCEHLNRALIIEQSAAQYYRLEQVNAVPQLCAGGSFAATAYAGTAYAGLENPVAVEEISAHAGMDIGNTLIGMHLRQVAVPIRLSVKNIGKASIIYARTRPKFIGGTRTVYDESII